MAMSRPTVSSAATFARSSMARRDSWLCTWPGVINGRNASAAGNSGYSLRGVDSMSSSQS